MARSFVPQFARMGALAAGIAAFACGAAASEMHPKSDVPQVAKSAEAVRPVPVSAHPGPVAGSGYILLALGHHHVKWGWPHYGDGAVISYAFVTAPTDRPGARNCRTIEPIAKHLPHSALGRHAFAVQIRRAMESWEAAVNVRFVPAADTRSADLLIGVEKELRGIAYADVTRDRKSRAPVVAIRRAAICFNPNLPWEDTLDGDVKTPEIRYVAAHELGHVLGLDHAWGDDKLMSFKYHEAFRGPQPADIAGAVFLYGPRRPTANVASRGPAAQAVPASAVPVLP